MTKRRMPSWDELADYRITFEIKRSLVPTGEPGDCIVPIIGRIFYENEEEEIDEELCGEMTMHLIQASKGENLAEACDAHSQAIYDAWEVLYDPECSNTLRETVGESCMGDDVLYIDSIDIEPKHRGMRLGHIAVLRAIEDIGYGAAIVALFPSSLEPNQDEKASETARRKLQRYWSEIGFEPVGEGDSGYYFLDPGALVSRISDIVLDLEPTGRAQ